MTKMLPTAAAAAACVLCAASAAAQSPVQSAAPAAPAGPAFVRVVLTLAHGAPRQPAHMIVTRRPGEGYRVVIPRDSVSTESLRAAMHAVYALLERDGDTHRDDREIAAPFRRSVVMQSPESRRLLEQVLAAGAAAGPSRPASVAVFVPGATARKGARRR